MNERPKYIIRVRRDWRYGPRARFWDIQEWRERDGKGYWANACKGGLNYTERGMWRSVNKRLKKMKFGYQENYFTLDKQPIQYANCLDADADTCPPNDPNCMWRMYHCDKCNNDIKISQRGLTGKYMISDHDRVCKNEKK